jgi:hypothetical protein
MIFFRFNKISPQYWKMIGWCKTNTTDYKFTKNYLTAITGVWLNDEDAIIFRLTFDEYFL